jgi:hypothetical protein
MIKKTKKVYDERYFGIELLIEEYKVINPLFLSIKLKEYFDEDLTPNEIHDYINAEEDYEKESWTINMRDIFESRDQFDKLKYEQIS